MLNRRMAAFKIRLDKIAYDARKKLDALQDEIDGWGVPEEKPEPPREIDPLLNIALAQQQELYNPWLESNARRYEINRWSDIGDILGIRL